MKTTGIVRRVDDLGRIVIPKEIRKALNIREGEPLELFVEDNRVIFQKYGDSVGFMVDDLREALEEANRPDLAKMVDMIGKIYKAE